MNDHLFYRKMRIKDEEKQAALFEATVKTVKRRGVRRRLGIQDRQGSRRIAGQHSTSIMNNKEDLLVSTYVDIKRDFSRAILRDFDAGSPHTGHSSECMDDHVRIYFPVMPEYFRFSDQFANSPYYAQIDRSDGGKILYAIDRSPQTGYRSKNSLKMCRSMF